MTSTSIKLVPSSSSTCLPIHRRIALYGLSADPPTGIGGHVGIVQALTTLSMLDEIHVLPVYRHTYQNKRERLVSFEHRFQMCQLAFSNISPKVIISDAEYHSWKYAVQGLSDEDANQLSVGTAALLEYLYSLPTTTTTSTEYYFCLGADAFLDLIDGKWKESQRVLQLLQGRLVVFHRPMSSSTKDTINQKQVEDELLQAKVNETIGAQLLHVHSLTTVSSSQVRQCSDEIKLAEMVTPSVLQYIKTNKLYQFHDTN